jgi:hypothetical protein
MDYWMMRIALDEGLLHVDEFRLETDWGGFNLTGLGDAEPDELGRG